MLVRTHSTILMIALAAASAAAAGCAGAQSDDEVAAVQAALEEENGGMTDAREAPGFADPAVLAAAELVTTYADSANLTAPIEQAAGATGYRVMLLWGHLPAAHDHEDGDVAPAPAKIDWTGGVSVDEGAIGVKRTIKFDPHDGVAPRTSPSLVSFVSHTRPRVDGLLLKVVIPSGGAKVLHFDTASLSADIDLSELAAKGGGVAPLGDGRNGLAWLGFEETPGVARGFVVGKWGKLQADVGKLRGRVVDGDGELLGHVRGIWGHSEHHDGDVFFGKYIDATGDFQGLFGGKYGDGKLEGVWGTKEPESAGVVEGRYSDGYEKHDGRGVFLARWSEKAAQ